MSLEFDIGMVCDLGGAKPKKGNQDVGFVLMPGHVIGAIDGMGGPGGGRTAAVMVASTFQSLTHIEEPDPGLLASTVKIANEKIYRANIAQGRPSGNRMGAVGTIAWINQLTGQTLMVQVGDSRGYLYRQGILQAITTDQTPLAGMDESKRQKHRERHLVDKAFGTREQLDPDYYQLTLQSRDKLLLCSDGLTDVVASETLIRTLGYEISAREIAQSLLRAAIKNGTRDNVTAIVIHVLGNTSLEGASQTLCPA